MIYSGETSLLGGEGAFTQANFASQEAVREVAHRVAGVRALFTEATAI